MIDIFQFKNKNWSEKAEKSVMSFKTVLLQRSLYSYFALWLRYLYLFHRAWLIAAC